MNKIFKISLVALPVALLFIMAAANVHALEVDTSYVPLTTLPGVLSKGVPTNPVAVLKGIYGLAIGIGSIIAVIMIILAGFK
ncbi:hypothetical protein KW799_01530, partial [Candidatus Parcubacteria bacterium]|nr:hypothetical protein [Candidatus Parcubacteria bacterium]